MNSQAVIPRQSKYCTAIEAIISELGHATNLELLARLRLQYPSLSATTVHRATQRLAERGQLGIAPPARDGAMRYDANTQPHDHFVCQLCGRLRDADIRAAVVPIIQAAIADCEIGGRLVISGLCKNCKQSEMEQPRA